MLKLKPQYFGHLMLRADSLEKTLRSVSVLAEGRETGSRGAQRGERARGREGPHVAAAQDER